jgi:hypothetical protein
VFDVSFGSLRRVVSRVDSVAMRKMGMVRGLLVVAALVMFCGFLVVPCGVFVMFGSFMMMVGGLLAHESLLRSSLSQMK